MHTDKPHTLLLDHLDLLVDLDHSLPVLDLACGNGQNGLVLAKHGIPVIFADQSVSALAVVARLLERDKLKGKIWQVDLEQAGVNLFAGQGYSAILVFRYLHRPLIPVLQNVVMPGGLIVYETFTVDQRQFGRPQNPDFLLTPDELKKRFQRWETIHYYEGIRPNPNRGIAQLVARKPMPVV